MYRQFVKRWLDVAISLLCLLLFLPALAALGLLIRVRLGTPLLFRQLRPGKGARPFQIYKFRTMTQRRDEAGNLLGDAERLTPFGRFLRSTSLDELPELWNVLVGDMSLVGPRPLLMQYLPLYNEFQKRRHEVRPGLTGWAQVNGRNAISWDERFALDVWYVEHVSFWLDAKIVFMTVKKLLKRQDVNQPGHATVEYFQGATSARDANS